MNARRRRDDWRCAGLRGAGVRDAQGSTKALSSAASASRSAPTESATAPRQAEVKRVLGGVHRVSILRQARASLLVSALVLLSVLSLCCSRFSSFDWPSASLFPFSPLPSPAPQGRLHAPPAAQALSHFFLLPVAASPRAALGAVGADAIEISAKVTKSEKKEAPNKAKKLPPRALQVVRPNDRHTGFEIDEAALTEIEKIPAPVSVVTAVGSIHTGKSFFLSQLLAFSFPEEHSHAPPHAVARPGNATEASASTSPSEESRRFTAFPVGYTVHPGTQGLSFWSEPLRVDRRTGQVVAGERRRRAGKAGGGVAGAAEESDITHVLLLDTEGFGGPNVTRSYDQLLYAVASLVSSEIVFTTMKMIDAQSLQLLEDLTRDANLFNLRAHAQSVNRTRIVPPLSSSRREDKEEAAGVSSKDSKDPQDAKARVAREAEITLKDSVAGSALFSSLAPCCLSWIVQDFVQDLEGLTALQWLERLIDTNRWSASPAEVEKNFWKEKRGLERNRKPEDGDEKDGFLRHSLRSFYDSIHCVALPAPSASSEALQRLDLLPLTEMTSVYKRAFLDFKDALLKRAANHFKAKSHLFHPSSDAGRGAGGDERACRRAPSQAGQGQQPRESEGGDRCAGEEDAEGKAHGDRGAGRGDARVEAPRRGEAIGRVAMSGKDIADLLRFLVRAANLNMFEDVEIFMNHFSSVRSDLAKNDLLLLFDEDMQRFLSVHPPPLPPLFFSFADSLRQQLLQQWRQQIAGQEGNHAQEVQQRQQEEMIQKLNEKVEKFRGVAEEQVRKYCRGFCDKRLHLVQQEIQKQQQRLPMAPQALAEWAIYEQRLQRSLLTEEVNHGGRDFAAADVCEEELRAYDEKVENLFLFLHKENTKKITADMQKAEEQTVVFFAEQLKQHPLEMLHPLEQFRALLFEWKTAAWEIFQQKVEDLRAVRQIYSVFEKRLTSELKRLEQQALQQWNEKCTEIAFDVLQKWSSTYKAEVIASFPKVQALPVDEDILHTASQNKMQDALEEMNELYCTKTAPWQQVARELKEVLLEKQKELELQNVEAIKTNCKEPLDKLLKGLKPEAESRYLWTTFVALAKQEALALLASQNAQSRATVLLSDRLVKRVTEHWLETDVKSAYADTVWRNMVNLCQQIAGGIVGTAGLAVFSTYNMWIGVLMMTLGAWLLFGILTLIGWMRGAFKFTVQGLWHGLQDRVGLEAAVGIFFVAAAVVGAAGFRWLSIRKSRNLGYVAGHQAFQANACSISRPCSVDPGAYSVGGGLSRPSQSGMPQPMEYQTPLGVRSSAVPTSSIMYESMFPDAERKSRYSTAYIG
ncbi:guanylate-binding protein, N-terminal domain-containing protein [Besnoitia besnoiti]|uniref:Guanylate-binding protein, N-terminal domain-containing protein n=1 Tax=Besnoitia besnoiti TaxID=94643 RepID=A0A2A9M882_BESBE|nr:guanylate-binding protein, N-terminal domain-containing protein [Besnoitia besnoiti]PFH31590.1 guanylate-binding protein, N-terminal domain-containing protein [Besnoitia besnoiti]